MLLLVTGASGAGKSTVRHLIAPHLAPEVECVELGGVVEIPRFPDLAWRHRATEAVVRRALERQAEGRHLLLAGDPVAPGEVLAAPSAARLDAIHACLLDLDADAQAARLNARGDDPALAVHHRAFAEWMRAHARDPRHMPHVLTGGGWPEMQWERWLGCDPADGGWTIEVIDGSTLSPDQAGAAVLGWCRRALGGELAPLAPR